MTVLLSAQASKTASNLLPEWNFVRKEEEREREEWADVIRIPGPKGLAKATRFCLLKVRLRSERGVMLLKDLKNFEGNEHRIYR